MYCYKASITVASMSSSKTTTTDPALVDEGSPSKGKDKQTPSSKSENMKEVKKERVDKNRREES